jgi:hypothetical protein
MISTVFEAALRSLLMALAVWAGLRTFRVRNVVAQKAAWGLVLAAALIMPLLVPVVAHWQIVPANATIFLPNHPLSLLTALKQNPQAPVSRAPQLTESTAVRLPKHAPAASQNFSRTAEPDSIPTGNSPSSVISDVYAGAPLPASPPQPTLRRGVSFASIAWFLYLAVTAGLLFRLLYGLASALWLLREAERVSIVAEFPMAADLDLRATGAVTSPVTIGSAVVLPSNFNQWDAEKLRIVLAHERSHVRQGDFYLQLLSGFYAALVWFSPLGWWLKRKLSDLAETISDRAGLEQAASCSSYAQILLEFAATPRPTLTGVAMARKGSLSRRIERLLNDTSFRQAFSGGRRAFTAILLVPVAIFGATALIRVQAAQQATEQPTAEPEPAVQPSPSPLPEASASGESMPEPLTAPVSAPSQPTIEIETGGPVAPRTITPVVAPEPPNPAAPPPPTAGAVTVIPMGAPFSPGPPMPAVSLNRMVGEDGVIAIAQASESTTSQGRGYSYHYSSDGDSYAIVTGDQRDHIQFSGDIHTSQIDKARKLAHGDFLWFTHDGKSYLLDDPANVAQIEAMYKPMEELGKQQEALGRQQEALGKQQEALGRLQEQASIPAPDLHEEMARLNVAMAKLQAKAGKSITQEELGEIQAKVGELQEKLGSLQGLVGAKQGELGGQQGKLGEQQGRLGAEQGRLGAEQGRLATEADQKVKSILNESLQNGKAKPVQ